MLLPQFDDISLGTKLFEILTFDENESKPRNKVEIFYFKQECSGNIDRLYNVTMTFYPKQKDKDRCLLPNI